ncbi:MAG TPA: hypothetical protein DDW50_12725 [Firmicutes bacterium]|jgi:hypothetical protein|nr:hypothetical protein [Bacillota bacterium]
MNYYDIFLTVKPQLKTLADEMENTILRFDPSISVYNPFSYGIECFLKYLELYFSSSLPRFLVIGLNPGIDGAIQTCIPFTDPYHCRECLGIDPCEYIMPYRNVAPNKYIKKPIEKTAKIVYEAIEEMGNDKFFSEVLFLNAFPLGMTVKAAVPKQSGFYEKNWTPKDLKGILREKGKEFAENYLKLITMGLSNYKVVTLGEYARERAKKIRVDYCLMHPSPVALNTKKITREEWKAQFKEIFQHQEFIKLITPLTQEPKNA